MNESFQYSLIKSKADSNLQQIANALLLNASSIKNIGLFNGKMGIAIFLYRYAKYSGEIVFAENAGKLVDEIYEDINNNISIDFAEGLAGIGWGIEYLIQNGFVETDTDDVCDDIDSILNSYLVASSYLHKSAKVISGIGLYFLIRLHHLRIDDKNLKSLQISQSLINIIDDLERLLVFRRFLDFYITSFSISELTAFLHFLLEVYNLKINLPKVEKLFEYFPPYIDFCLLDDCIYKDKLSFNTLLIRAIDCLDDSSLREKYLGISARIKVIYSKDNNDSIIKSLSRVGLNQLLYQTDLHDGEFSEKNIRKAFRLNDNERKRNKPCNDNLGLDCGLAGFGLALIQFLSKMQYTVVSDRNITKN